MTLFKKIKAMSLEEMADFLSTFDMEKASNEYCLRCEKEHGGNCPFDVLEKLGATCPYDDKAMVKNWLTQEIVTDTNVGGKKIFTPEEVRAMSRAEVKANYTRILESMKHWN